MKIVDYRTNDDLDIEFLDDYHYIKEHNTYSNFKSGSVKNPYDPTVSGIGFVGVGKHKTYVSQNVSLHSECYVHWFNMIKRCHDSKWSEMYPAYYGISTVCNEWLNFQNFAEWYESHKYPVNERLHIDKDILYPGNKIYSPSTCILVPQRINELFCISTRKKDGLPQGIRKTKTGYSVSYCSENLGIAKTYDEACARYSLAKTNKIIEVANEYKDIIPFRLYDALLNYEVKVA